MFISGLLFYSHQPRREGRGRDKTRMAVSWSAVEKLRHRATHQFAGA